MDEKKTNFTFDDLFEDKPVAKSKRKSNDYSKSKGIIIIVGYFVLFFLLASLIQIIFIAMPSMTERYNATESVVRYLEKEKGVSYTTAADYNNLDNPSRVESVTFGEYVILFSKDTFEAETFDEAYIETVFSGESFTYNETAIKRVENASVEGFFNDTFTPSFDAKATNYFNLTTEAMVLSNFIIYFIATIVFIYLSFSVLKLDYKALDKRFLAILSAVGLGYLFMLGGNLIGNSLGMILSNLFNHHVETSVNQEAINQTLTSPLAPLMIIATVIGAPVVEELVFRKGFFSVIKNKWVALVVSSLMFSLMHVLGETTLAGFIINLVVYGSMGAAFGFIYIYNKKNIYPVILVHALSNLIAVVIFYIMPLLV